MQKKSSKRIEDLRARIKYHDQRYWELDSPEISDAEYDALKRELKALEATHSGNKSAYDFITIVAAPTIQLVTEKGLFGKPYIRLGKLIGTVGFSVFQWFGVLGFALAGHPALLGKLYTDVFTNISLEQFTKELTRTRGLVEKSLAETEGQEKTFFDLYTQRELRELGIDILARPLSDKLRKKMDMDKASNVISLAAAKGTAFGYHFPAKFKECWEREYRMQPDSEWQDACAHGLALPEVQQTLHLKEAIATIIEMALGWDAEVSHRFDKHDIKFLKGLVAGDDGISR